MKNIAKILLAFTLALLLIFGAVACDKDDEKEKVEETEQNNIGVFAVRYKGTNIELGSKAKKVLDKLGEPLSSNFVASCGEGAGDQWVYAYSSIFVYTVKYGEEEIIDGLKLRDDIADTSKAIRIGATKTSVKNAYGDKLVEKENRLLYTESFHVIEFSIDSNDKVTGIELRTEAN
ncbi:MAG: hypothetical protein E7670_06120 [Ruminococcaceae bacterium]|nr:hypothetical protein [Oscillospiraceae bacterium]